MINNQFKNIMYRIVVACFSGVLLWLSWPTSTHSTFTFLIFIAWVPLLWLATRTFSVRTHFFGYALLTMLIWNALTTWWIYNASIPGAFGAIILNSIFMTLPWVGFHRLHTKKHTTLAYFGLIAYWMCFEYIHLHWDLSWPWLTLGNIFAAQPAWIQWYEYTGTSGGTLWILLVNILLWQAWENRNQYQSILRNRYVFWAIGVLGLPMLLSVAIHHNPLTYPSNKKNIVIVQPSIDPYTEKFASGTQQAQIQKLIQLSLTQVDSNTALLVWPETAVPTQVMEDEIKINDYYQPIFKYVQQHPQLTLITGINSYKRYFAGSIPSSTRKDGQGIYYDAFNTALAIDTAFRLPIYHKSKLVPGVETLPFWLSFLGTWFEDFGGMSGTLGVQKERAVFTDIQHYYKAAPIICYESIYGSYVTEYVRKGANVLTIITNDGWWGDTYGYKQHLLYGRLRAIETRRWVARSANTGVSCFIDPAGNIINPQAWNRVTAIKTNVPTCAIQTFYVRYGDILSLFAIGFTLLILAWSLIQYVRRQL